MRVSEIFYVRELLGSVYTECIFSFFSFFVARQEISTLIDQGTCKIYLTPTKITKITQCKRGLKSLKMIIAICPSFFKPNT